jgi:hypothetical protein
VLVASVPATIEAEVPAHVFYTCPLLKQHLHRCQLVLLTAAEEPYWTSGLVGAVPVDAQSLHGHMLGTSKGSANAAAHLMLPL